MTTLRKGELGAHLDRTKNFHHLYLLYLSDLYSKTTVFMLLLYIKDFLQQNH